VIEQPFVIERLGTQNRASFSCGDTALDVYLRERASQEEKRGAARFFVLVERSLGVLAGYYTLCSSSVIPERLPSQLQSKLPRYKHIPAALIGRLAVDLRHQQQGLGQALLADAIQRAAAADVASALTIVDAYPTAVMFYRNFGFLPFADHAENLYYPLSESVRVLAARIATSPSP